MVNKYLTNAINKTVSTTGLAVQPLSETNIFKANTTATDYRPKCKDHGGKSAEKHHLSRKLAPTAQNDDPYWFFSFKCGP